jgi:hypothetical protein
MTIKMCNRAIILITTTILLLSCTRKYIPKTGDILFQDLDCGELCDAIEKVTTGINETNLSHVGVVSIEHDSAYVYEAIGSGVSKTPFDVFRNRSVDALGNPKILAGILKQEFQYTIPPAVESIKKLMAKPYDSEFDINNESYYCSELVYFAFRDSTGKYLFELKPMTFRDPETRQTFPSWENYFKNLQVPVPEGKPGINPGGISRSPLIDIIFKFY